MRVVFSFISRQLPALVLLFFCLTPAMAASLRVAVVLSAEGAAYREFAAALREQLDPSLFTLTVVGTSTSPPQADLYVAAGMDATSSLVRVAQPVLSVMAPRAGIETLHLPSSFAAIYIEQPYSRQLALISAALPQARSVGVLYSGRPPELALLQQLSSSAKLRLIHREVPEPSRLAADLSLLLQNSDVLLVLPDAAIYRPDTIRNILLETYRQRVPMIGLSPHYVRAGALSAVYSTPEQIARQAVRMLGIYAATGRMPNSQYPDDFEVAVNTRVARSLGLNIKNAEQLRASIRGK